jgi:hypothetical protein
VTKVRALVKSDQSDSLNDRYYREVLERLRKRVHRVRPEIADTWMLHHDKAPRHTAISVNEFLTKKVFQCFPKGIMSVCSSVVNPKFYSASLITF